MLKNLLRSSPGYSVDIQMQQHPVYLYPAAAFGDKATLPRFSSAHGHVLLNVLKPITLKSIVVEESTYWLTDFGRGCKTGDISTQSASVIANPKQFDVGEHHLSFNLEYACDYSYPCRVADEVSNWRAMIRTCLAVRIVQVDGSSDLLDVSKRLTEFPSGPSGTKRLPSLKLMVAPNPAEVGDLPGPLTIIQEGFVPLLGAFSLSLLASSFTQSGLGRLSVRIPELSAALVGIEAMVLQKVAWKAPNSEKTTFSPERKIPFYRLGRPMGTPLCAIKMPFQIDTVIRFPSDNQIFFSTQPGTKTPLTISHQIRIAVTVINAEGIENTINFDRDVSIATCMCLPDSLLVPEYKQVKETLPGKQQYQPLRIKDPWPCICGFSTEQLQQHLDDRLYKPNATLPDDALPLPPTKPVPSST